jgi:hypothetical protein
MVSPTLPLPPAFNGQQREQGTAFLFYLFLSSRFISASQNPDRLLAVIATAVAGTALLIAFVQVFLQYITSSPLREKCNVAAIGCASRLVKYGPGWTVTVHYPLLDLTPAKLIGAARYTEQHGIEVLGLQEEGQTGFSFIEENEKTSWATVKHEDICLFTNRRLQNGEREKVTLWQLPWRKAMVYLWFKLRHRPQFPRPKSCWAQMLYALGADDVTALVYGMADASTVPSQLDAPMQRITISQMGKIAFLLNFNQVEINHREHTLDAYGPHGRITTIQVPSFGGVLHFEGDTHAIRKAIRKCPVSWTIIAKDLITARLNFPNVNTNGFYCPLNALAQSIVDAPHEGDWFNRQMAQTARARANSIAGKIYLEAKNFKALTMHGMPEPLEVVSPDIQSSLPSISSPPRDDNQESSIPWADRFDEWRLSHRLPMPTILTLMYILPLPSVATPFPHDILLPYVPVLAVILKKRAEDILARADVFVSAELQTALEEGSVMFHLETSDYTMCRDTNATAFGQRSWAQTAYQNLHADMPELLREKILPAGVGTSRAKVLLTKDTLSLLRNFDPVHWSLDFMEEMKFEFFKYGASNLLWLQVLLLDMAIQHTVNGRLLRSLDGTRGLSVTDDVRRHPNDNVVSLEIGGSWTIKGGDLARALCLAGCPLEGGAVGETPSFPHWDLSQIIHSAELNLDAPTTEYLAMLLELRMAFMVAYLLSFADSSAVYYAEFQDFSLPIGLSMRPQSVSTASSASA